MWIVELEATSTSLLDNMTQHPIAGRLRSNGSRGATPKRLEKNGETSFPLVDDYDDIESEGTDWENELELPMKSDGKGPMERSTTSGGSSVRSTPRRKRFTPRIAHTPRKQSSLPPPSLSKTIPSIRPTISDRPTLSRDAVVDGTLQGAAFTTRYMLDVLSTAIHLLRKPLSILLFLWLLGFIMGQVSQTLRTVFLPICVIPGISSSPMCRSLDSNLSSGRRVSRWADYPKLVDVQSKTFGQLMDEVVGDSALALEIKKAEMATTDLIALIKISDLKARDALVGSLNEFVHDSKKVGRGMQKFASRVGGAVDNIMAMNEFALQSIESARNAEPSFWSLTSLVSGKSRRKKLDMIIAKTFEDAMDVLSTNMERLILEAEANYQNLNALEEQLGTLHELISREDSSLASAKTELLADLWTKLGGNRKTLRNFDSHLVLLRELGTYRKQALVHVVAALQVLRTMSEDMEDMRERVAEPNLVGPNVPVEVHMKSIHMGLERLREGRTKAKRLSEDAVRRVLSIDEPESGEGV